MESHGGIRSRKIVLLDTNFLLIPGQFGVDVFSELKRLCDFSYEVCVLAATVDELERVSADKAASAKNRRAAKLGMQLLRLKGVKALKQERKVFKSADKAILEFAAANHAVVATQDRLLQQRLRAKGVSVIVLRQRQYLQFA